MKTLKYPELARLRELRLVVMDGFTLGPQDQDDLIAVLDRAIADDTTDAQIRQGLRAAGDTKL